MVRIAIALNQQNEIQQDHFGEAFNYKIYDLKSNAVIPQAQIENPMRNFDEETHGNAKKGQQITQLLKENKVEAVVSKEFGKNIKIINQHFVPIIAKNNTIEETLSSLRGLVPEIEQALQDEPKSMVRIK